MHCALLPRLLLPIALTLALGAPAQEPFERFKIRIAKGIATGADQYQFRKTDSGYELNGKVRLEQKGQAVEFKYELSLSSDWLPVRYRLESSVGSQTQTVEGNREGNNFLMRATGGGQITTRPAPVRPETVLLDNLVGSHYQVLANRLGGQDRDRVDWSVIVPQRMLSLTAKVTRVADESGVYLGKACSVRRYTVQLAGILEDLWIETATNRVMRIHVPVQDVELVREGFEAAVAATEAQSDSPAIERDVIFPSGGLQFPGTLTLPPGAAGRVPVVVLVHGSGPNDRDETIGPNKPFRDIARGLAARGIATLRYDKRTFAFKKSIDLRTVTIEEEVLQDAVAALSYARSLPEADRDRLFVLGHSLGGTMAPFIAERFPDTRGVVLMAASPRPIDELIVEQSSFQLKLAGAADSDIESRLTELRSSFARVRSGSAKDEEMVFFAPARYWRNLFAFDLAAAIAKLEKPVLVLQGGKDVQVRRADYDLIDKALASKSPERKELHWLDSLNHLFMKVEGAPTAAEYGRAARVDDRVVELIAAWIGKQAARR